MRIVPLCLDSDPSLIPLSCKVLLEKKKTTLSQDKAASDNNTAPDDTDDDEHRNDDFSFWSEQQAKRISTAIKQIFDVEYAPEVIVADANLMALAKRILVSKEILSFGPGGQIA
jgi:phosphatidylethanolamine N-methyltransferase